jgi:AraC family transcriptional regulator
LLERAAYQLGRTELSVTELAFDAQYGSLEAFTRAFRKAFGVSPSHYRRLGVTHYRLSAKNGIHFYAPGSRQKGARDMDLFDRFAGAESWYMRRILERAQSLTDEQLDRPLESARRVIPWEEPEKSLRDLLERVVFTKEIWTAALAGREMPSNADNVLRQDCYADVDADGATREAPSNAANSVRGMLARLEVVDAEFQRIMREVSEEGRWDDTFVDALCEPPETFTFGGVFAHIITFNTHRRLLALDVMRRYGIDDLGYGDPIEWESSLKTTATV